MGGQTSKEGAIVGCILFTPICIALLKDAGIWVRVPGAAASVSPLVQALWSHEVIYACIPPEAWDPDNVNDILFQRPPNIDIGTTFVAVDGLGEACVDSLVAKLGSGRAAEEITLLKTSPIGVNVTRLTEDQVGWVVQELLGAAEFEAYAKTSLHGHV
ncbi:hypothetical protein GQ53DRAFT_824818 [Thozetella sp. PMI_491]|nr:hypothetical protein GQ53DRAFT_824818 [Thozetella sp. PMI_491]